MKDVTIAQDVKLKDWSLVKALMRDASVGIVCKVGERVGRYSQGCGRAADWVGASVDRIERFPKRAWGGR